MLEVLLVSAGSIVALEVWRRHLARTRVLPRWVHPAVWGLFAGGAAGTIAAWLLLERAWDAIEASEAANKATRLAEGIASAMNANAIAIAALGCAAVVLGVCTLAIPRRTSATVAG